MPEYLLEGVRVADFSWAYVGPLTAKALADSGAEVIKIEGLTRPDVERAVVPPFKDNIPGLNRGGHSTPSTRASEACASTLPTQRERIWPRVWLPGPMWSSKTSPGGPWNGWAWAMTC